MQLLVIVVVAFVTFFRSVLFITIDIADKVFITTECFSELIVNVIVFFSAEAIAVMFL